MREIDDDDDDPRGDDDEDGEPVETPPPPPPVVAAPPKNKGGRPRKIPPQSMHTGVGTAANVPPPTSDSDPSTWGSDPYSVWPLLLEWIAAGCGKGQPMGPGDIRINVYRMGVPGNPQRVLLGAIDGEIVAGLDGTHPSDALRDRVIDDFHFPSGFNASATYKLEMTWRKGGRIIKSGDMLLPSKDEIRLLRIQKENREAGNRMAGMGAAPYQAPPQHSQHYPPQLQPQPHYYPPPPPQQQAYNPQLAQIQNELDRAREREARLQGQLDQASEDIRLGRIPNLTPEPAQPAASGTSAVVTEVIAALVAMGIVGRQAPAGVGAAPPPAPTSTPVAPPVQPAPAADPFAAIEATIAGMARLKKMARAVDMMTGDSVDAVAEPIPNEPPPPPDDGLSWTSAPTGANWPDGSPIVYAKKKDGTGIDWTGVLFSNGPVGQKVMEVGEQVIRPMAEGIQKMMAGMVVQPPQGPVQETQENKAHVTNGIPSGARDAGGDFPAT